MNKILLSLVFVFSINVFASSSLYFLPQENKQMLNRLIKEINISKESIKISMYNFSYKKIAKELIKAKNKRDIDIRVFLDYKKVQNDKTIYNMLKKAGISVKLITKKLHTKIVLFDSDILMFGSINFTKDSFKKNYEVVMFSDDSKDIKKAAKFFSKTLKDK